MVGAAANTLTCFLGIGALDRRRQYTSCGRTFRRSRRWSSSLSNGFQGYFLRPASIVHCIYVWLFPAQPKSSQNSSQQFVRQIDRLKHMGTSISFWSRNSHEPENLWAEETFFSFLGAFLILSRATASLTWLSTTFLFFL